MICETCVYGEEHPGILIRCGLDGEWREQLTTCPHHEPSDLVVDDCDFGGEDAA